MTTRSGALRRQRPGRPEDKAVKVQALRCVAAMVDELRNAICYERVPVPMGFRRALDEIHEDLTARAQ